ncbi:alpha/beta-hydrolase, partial [Dendrothele bispora CBS 962.96]
MLLSSPIIPLSVLSLVAFAIAVPSRTRSGSYSCSEFSVPLTVSASTVKLNLTAPQNQIELTGLVADLSHLNATIGDKVTVGRATVNATYDIWSQLCVPDDFTPDGILEFTIHGLGFDHSYWNFKNGSQYNYAEAALAEGHAIFLYDRLSTGKSSKPDGIQEVQIGTETAIATGLVDYLRTSLSFGKIVGLGHSYGSVQMLSLAAEHGNLFDASVLTGFSAFVGGLPTTFASFDPKIASEVDPEKYGSLESSYTITEDATNEQLVFFAYPGFDPKILEETLKIKSTITVGQALTITNGFNQLAQNYTNPVVVVTGEKDIGFCGGDCNAPGVDGAPNVLATVSGLFPAASNSSVHIIENTGHGLNMHLTAPETYRFIQQWIKEVL